MYSSKIYLIISYHLSIGAVNVRKLKLISWFASIFIILELVFRATVPSQNVAVSSACKLFLNIIQIDRIILISIKFYVYYTRYKIQILFTFLHRARANWFEYRNIRMRHQSHKIDTNDVFRWCVRAPHTKQQRDAMMMMIKSLHIIFSIYIILRVVKRRNNRVGMSIIFSLVPSNTHVYFNSHLRCRRKKQICIDFKALSYARINIKCFCFFIKKLWLLRGGYMGLN